MEEIDKIKTSLMKCNDNEEDDLKRLKKGSRTPKFI